MNGIDRRTNPRTPLNLPVRLEIPNPPQNIPSNITAESFDISKGGIGVNIKNLILPPGLSGTLNIDFPDSTLTIDCKIAWSSNSTNGESRSGIYFVKLENGHLSILNKIANIKPLPKRKFAFITNLRCAGDWQRVVYTSKFLQKETELATIKKNPGYVIWSHFDVYKKVEGYIIVVLLTGKEILSMPPKTARNKILEAALYAQDKLGVEYIGLGSYVPSVTKQGLWLKSRPEIKAFLTHGDHLTTWIALEGIREKTGLILEESTIAIIGASGLLGQPISRILAKDAKKLILIGRNIHKLNKLMEVIIFENNCLKNIPFIATEISAINKADLVISVTSSPDAIIKEDYLKKDVVIYDLAQPMDITPEICINRPDVIKIDGGFVNMPGIELGIDLGTPKGSAFACLGDAILQCLEDTKQHFVGPVEPKFVEKLGSFAQKYGFRHVDPCCFSWKIPETYISHRAEKTKTVSTCHI